jgi:predicted deacylase
MPTDMIAHYVETVLMPMVDYCFDFHAGGASLNYLPSLILDRPRTKGQRSKLERLVAAFQPPRLLYMDMLGEDRLIAAAAERHGVCFFTGEFGGGAGLDLTGLKILGDGLRRVLAAVGVLRGDDHPRPRNGPVEPRVLSVNGPQHYLFATRPGIFEPSFRLGDEVEKGMVAGSIHDPYAPWAKPEQILFAASGRAVCIRTRPNVVPGDCLGHLASDVSG